MALIQWDDSLSVGIAEIDGQHQKLVNMINALNDAMRDGKGKEVLGKLVNALAAYATTHFGMEERYFDQFGYPDADAHKAEHRAFVQKVGDFKDGFEQGKLGLSVQIMTFLSDWLRSHIKQTDKKYCPCFRENGLK